MRILGARQILIEVTDLALATRTADPCFSLDNDLHGCRPLAQDAFDLHVTRFCAPRYNSRVSLRALTAHLDRLSSALRIPRVTASPVVIRDRRPSNWRALPGIAREHALYRPERHMHEQRSTERARIRTYWHSVSL